MPVTYEPIATTTLGSNATTISFTSISSAFTDLRLVLFCPGLSAADFPHFVLNADTATNYALSRIRGDGTTATGSAMNSVTNWQPVNATITGGVSFFITLDLMNYTDTSMFKTGLISYNANEYGSGNVARCAAIYRSTSAITQIRIGTNNGNSYTANTNATLYGILKA